MCIDEDFLCDNTNDCGDMTDEVDCDTDATFCSFEENQPCIWTQENEQDDLGKWEISCSLNTCDW